ncbi:MAG: LysM peptidoglycan-binding domain-containing protein [Planctomycetales bacterium]
MLKDWRPSDVTPRPYERPVPRPTEPTGTPAPSERLPQGAMERSPLIPASRPALTPAERTSAADRPLGSSPIGGVPLGGNPEKSLTRPGERAVSDRPATDRAAPERSPSERPAPAESALRDKRKTNPMDWGLAPAQPRGSISRVLGMGVLALGLAAGGYFGWQHYSASSGNPEAAADDNVAQSDPAGTDDDSQTDDPFSQPFDDSDSSGSHSIPRVARHGADATPIAARGTRAQAAHIGDNSETSLELPLDLDEPDADQSEPDADEPPPRMLPAPGRGTPRDGAAPARLHPLRNSPATPARPSGRQEGKNAKGTGRRLASDPRSITTVDATEDGSQGDSLPELSSDEALDGFEPEELTGQRAASRTVVIRPEETPDGEVPPEDSDDDWVIDETARPKLKGPQDASDLASSDENRVPIRPRSVASRSTPVETRIMPRDTQPIEERGRNPQRAESGRKPALQGESYTVAPNDNFWTISRKLYGSSRYFQALARHNQERIPDPTRLRPGMQIATPPAAVLEKQYSELIDKSGVTPSQNRTPAEADDRPWMEDSPSRTGSSKPATAEPAAAGYFYSKAGEPMYRIGADDTLSGIAQRHLGRASRWNEIFEQNRDILSSHENLTVGTVIRLPADASRLSLAPEAVRRR